MPADAFHYSFAVQELNSLLSQGKINKISMPLHDVILLTVRANRTNHMLLLSASAARPRMHLTSAAYENPAVAPAFLMHLRRHIGGGVIESISQHPYERFFQIKLRTFNDLSIQETKTLIIEIMGRQSNIILVNADGRISDSIKHISPDLSSARAMLPGLPYQPPAERNKARPDQPDKLESYLKVFQGGDLQKHLLETVAGLAPVTIQEILYTAGLKKQEGPLDSDAVNRLLSAFSALLRTPTQPCVCSQNGVAQDFLIRQFGCLAAQDTAPSYAYTGSLNEAMDLFYSHSEKKQNFQAKSNRLKSLAAAALAKYQKKLGVFLEKMHTCEQYEQDRVYGDLITSNIYRIKKGESQIVLNNYMTGANETIQLDHKKTPSQNAQVYYKAYTKKKKSIENLHPLIEEADTRIASIESILQSLHFCTDFEDLSDIETELIVLGVLPSKQPDKKKPVCKVSAPHCITVNGYRILIGKNNIQNDRITRAASPTDIWLHTKSIHGSHVLIECPDGVMPSESVILEAACYAAYYSKASRSQNVPVDYTQARYVKKPSGAAPGKVIYTHQHTVYADPKPLEKQT